MNRRINRREFFGTAAVASTVLARCSSNPCPAGPIQPPLAGCRGGYRFQNWAQTVSCRPSSYCQPRSVEEVVDVVKRAAAGKTVRTVGAGHSWSPFVLTNDVLVNLDNMQSVISVDQATKRATVQAGIRLKNLIPALRRVGLGMANLGSVTEQSIAGAVSTGTHGTGLSFGNLATQVVGMKVVTGTGEVRTIDGGDELRAARISLGAFAIVVEMTLQCVSDYKLEYSAYWCKFDDVVDDIETLLRENERVRLWWLVWELGCRQDVIVTTMNSPGASKGFLGRFAKLAKNDTSSLPSDTKKLLKKRPKGTECSLFQSYVDDYNRVLNVPLLPVLHRECEYAIPLEKTADALRASYKLFDDRDAGMLMPVEVRFVRRDDSLLSGALGRDVCYIGASVRAEENPTELFMGFEPLMKSFDGRPHWGKYFTLTPSQAKDMFPDTYPRFCEIRNELDPRGVFATGPIRQLFG
jgi:FAD/FMN-containing dehydrogenase